ncbi:hypothetical protein JXB12_07415 [candidate division KSB1 bacterium]|nr:hypothetical protein [candidate division KSB1 bacterium]
MKTIIMFMIILLVSSSCEQQTNPFSPNYDYVTHFATEPGPNAIATTIDKQCLYISNSQPYHRPFK